MKSIYRALLFSISLVCFVTEFSNLIAMSMQCNQGDLTFESLEIENDQWYHLTIHNNEVVGYLLDHGLPEYDCYGICVVWHESNEYYNQHFYLKKDNENNFSILGRKGISKVVLTPPGLLFEYYKSGMDTSSTPLLKWYFEQCQQISL